MFQTRLPLALLALVPGSCRSAPAPAQAEAAPVAAVYGKEPVSWLGTFEPLRDGQASGGRLGFLVPAGIEEVASVLLDFDGADGHRAWACEHRLVARNGPVTLARWRMRGRLGIHPEIDLAFRRAAFGSGERIDFWTVTGDFGLRRLFGSLVLEPAAAPFHARTTLVTQTMFLESGIPLVGPSHADLEAGLVEDARRIRAWVEERAGSAAEAADPSRPVGSG